MSKIQTTLNFSKVGKTEGQSKKRKKRQAVYNDEDYVKLFMGGISVRLPPGMDPYPSQRQMMIRIIHCLKHSSNILIESPTGSGKTLALLASVCAWLDDYKKQQITKRVTCPEHGVGVVKANDVSLDTTLDASTVSMDQSSYVEHLKEDNENGISCGDISFVEDDLPSMKMDNSEFVPKETVSTCHCLPVLKVYYGTRTHKQISQVVKEFARLPFAGNTIKHAILASREQSCLNAEAKASGDVNAACRELLSPEGRSCLYKTNLKSLQAGRLRMEIERNDGGIWDIEDLVEALRSPALCPYFTSTHTLSLYSDIIFTPFNYLLDPIIRKATNVNLKNAIVILDEAHNLEDTCRDAASFQFKESEFIHGIASFNDRIRNVKNSIDAQAVGEDTKTLKAYYKDLNAMSNLAKSMFSLFKTVGTRVLNPLTAVAATQKFIDKNSRTFDWLDTQSFLESTQFEDGTLLLNDCNMCLKAFNGITKWTAEEQRILDAYRVSPVAIVLVEKYVFFMMYYCKDNNKSYYKMNFLFQPEVDNRTQKNFGMKKQEMTQVMNFNSLKPGEEGVLNFWCMLPAVSCAETFKDCHTVILASGTLCPTATLKTELGLDFAAEVEGRQVIPSEQMFTTIVPKGRTGRKFTCTYAGINDDFYHDLFLLIIDVCSVVPKGVLVFVSSYRILDMLRKKMSNFREKQEIEKFKKVFYEPNRSKELQGVLDEYTAAVQLPLEGTATGALMIAVYRGKVSEGIDFADDMARCVMCVGVPYPNAMDELVKQKKIYNDHNRKALDILSGDEWYSTQAFRALNQALGRCLRHINDWGAIMLVDERYREKMKPTHSDYKKISTWVRERLTCCSSYHEMMTNLQSFVRLRVQCDSENAMKKPVIKINTAKVEIQEKLTTNITEKTNKTVFGI